jgi:hypothetical protein
LAAGIGERWLSKRTEIEPYGTEMRLNREEALFELNVLAALTDWEGVHFVEDRPYDFLIRSKGEKAREVRIQVKLQRMLKQQPMCAVQAISLAQS